MNEVRCALACCVVVALIPFWATESAACGCLLPKPVILPRSGATLPANVPAFLWVGPELHGPPSEFALDRLDDGSQVSVSIDVEPFDETLAPVDLPRSFGVSWFLVVPQEELQPGNRYQLSVTHNTETLAAFWTIMEPVPLPETLGTLEVGQGQQTDLQLISYRGGCLATEPASWVDMRVAYTAEADAWQGTMFFNTEANGAPWTPDTNLCHPLRTESWVGPGVDRVLAVCRPIEPGERLLSLGEGVHEVKLRAWLPGTDIVLETNPAEVQLTCDAPVGEDASEPDAIESPPARGEDGDAGSCAASTPARPPWPTGWLVLLGVVFAWKRLTQRRQ